MSNYVVFCFFLKKMVIKKKITQMGCHGKEKKKRDLLTPIGRHGIFIKQKKKEDKKETT